MENAFLTQKRIKEILQHDKQKTPVNLGEVIKSDLFGVLKDYLVLEKQDIFVKIDFEDSGQYSIKMIAKGAALKALNYLK